MTNVTDFAAVVGCILFAFVILGVLEKVIAYVATEHRKERIMRDCPRPHFHSSFDFRDYKRMADQHARWWRHS